MTRKNNILWEHKPKGGFQHIPQNQAIITKYAQEDYKLQKNGLLTLTQSVMLMSS